jgi:hypothetical protein
MVCAICYLCVMCISKSSGALGIRVLATLFSKNYLHIWEGAVTKIYDTCNSVFLSYLYRNKFSSYLPSVNGVITSILKFQDKTTVLYRYSGHQLPSDAVSRARQCRPLS